MMVLFEFVVGLQDGTASVVLKYKYYLILVLIIQSPNNLMHTTHLM